MERGCALLKVVWGLIAPNESPRGVGRGIRTRGAREGGGGWEKKREFRFGGGKNLGEVGELCYLVGGWGYCRFLRVAKGLAQAS